MDVSSVQIAARTGYRALTFFAVSLLLCCGCNSSAPPQPDDEVVADTVVSVTESPTASPPPDVENAAHALPQPASEEASMTTTVDNSEATGAPSRNPAALRLPDDRPDINEERLKQAGIKRYAGRRLVLLSDLPAEKVAHLPALADELFEHLEKHFGGLPPAVDDSEFQVTGCIIGDEAKFRAADLMRAGQFTINHGRHFNYRFWMYDVEDDYYRRHLMLHEFTHCFMSCESGMNNLPSLWYFEGMAEYFATHLSGAGSEQSRFGILPASFDGFEGWGRVSELRRSFQKLDAGSDAAPSQLKMQTFDEVTPNVVDSFLADIQYASSWAVCWFLQNHPEYSKQIASLAPQKNAADFTTAFETFRRAAGERVAVDWLLVLESLREGFDVKRSWPVHTDTTALPLETKIAADRDWQDTGVSLKRGDRVKISCTGRFQVNDQPMPWISEPQGVSIEYFRGFPLGCVIAILTRESGNYISIPIRVGREAVITAPVDCRLWLQLNDTSAGRANNDGQVAVNIRETP